MSKVSGAGLEFATTQGRGLEIFYESSDETADGKSFAGQFVKLGLGNIAFVQCDVKLGSYFTGGTFRHGKGLQEFLVTSPLESFRNIGSDRNHCTAHLVHQAEIASEFPRARRLI